MFDPSTGSHIRRMNLIRHSAARDLRVDFFRGLALWWIYTDHIPGDVLGDYSLRNFATCDATEVFVLLAGYGAGLSYGMGLGRNGYISTAADVLKRAWTLYIAHIFLFVLFTAQVTYSATAMNRLNYLSETRLDVLGDDPYRSMLEAVLLRFQPSLLNILPLYVVLLVFFAATIWMLRWPRLLFGFSLAIYLLVRVTGLNLAHGTREAGFSTLSPGSSCSSSACCWPARRCRCPSPPGRSMPSPSRWRVLGVVVTLAIEPYPHRLEMVSRSVFRALVVDDKTSLYPLRLISILALTWLCVRLIRFDAAWLRSRWAAPLELLGQNSLPVFCSGIVFGFAARLGLEYDDRAFMQVAINLLGAIAMLAVGGLAAWYRTKGKGRPPRAVPSASPALLPVNAQTDIG